MSNNYTSQGQYTPRANQESEKLPLVENRIPDSSALLEGIEELVEKEQDLAKGYKQEGGQ